MIAIGSMNIFTVMPVPGWGRRIKPAGPGSLRN